MGPLIPLFWTSDDICPGFQSQSGFSYFRALLQLCATESSDSPLVQYLLTSWHLNFRFSVPKIENLTSTIWKGINFGFFSEFVNVSGPKS